MTLETIRPSQRNIRVKGLPREPRTLVLSSLLHSTQVPTRVVNLFATFLTCHSLFAFLLVARILTAQSITEVSNSAFSRIRDVVYEPGGRPFSGTLSLLPVNFGASNPPLVVVQVNDGLLSVTVVPTPSSSPLASYTATYMVKDSPTSWVEHWRVPLSDRLSLRDVRTPALDAPPRQAVSTTADIDKDVTLPLTIGDVTGLNTSLNAINSSLTSLANSESLMNIAVGSAANKQIIRGETPAGVLDGTNATFTLAYPPIANSVALSLNGTRLSANLDYLLSGSSITFSPNDIPKPGDTPQADYETLISRSIPPRHVAFRSLTLPIPISSVSGLANALNQVSGNLSLLTQDLASITTEVASITCPTLTVGQTPVGLINGTNATFTITGTGAVVGTTVSLYYNGVRQMTGVDYTLTGSSIQFLPVAIPQTGDLLIVDYCSK